MSTTYLGQGSLVAPGKTVRPAASGTLADVLTRLAIPVAIAGALGIVPNANTTIHGRGQDHAAIYATDSSTYRTWAARVRPITDLGWTRDQAAAMRQRLTAFAEDWNDSAMDAYDAL